MISVILYYIHMLWKIINRIILYISDDQVDTKDVEFDFLIDGEFLRLTLDRHLENKGISTVSKKILSLKDTSIQQITVYKEHLYVANHSL
jgi:hypothetical protein